MYKVKKVLTYSIMHNETYSLVMENIPAELEAEKFCTILNNQAEQEKQKLRKKSNPNSLSYALCYHRNHYKHLTLTLDCDLVQYVVK